LFKKKKKKKKNTNLQLTINCQTLLLQIPFSFIQRFLSDTLKLRYVLLHILSAASAILSSYHSSITLVCQYDGHGGANGEGRMSYGEGQDRFVSCPQQRCYFSGWNRVRVLGSHFNRFKFSSCFRSWNSSVSLSYYSFFFAWLSHVHRKLLDSYKLLWSCSRVIHLVKCYQKGGAYKI